MKKLLLFFFVLSSLVSCGDSSEDKATKRICNNFEKRILVDKERCFKDKKYFKELRFKHDVDFQIERIKEFNNKVDRFNSINLKTNDQDFLLVDIENFTKKNGVNIEASSTKLRDDLNRKKLKFKSYFEVGSQENSEEYTISLYNYMQYIFSISKKERPIIPNLSSAKFQNIEIKKKVETIAKPTGTRAIGIPLNNSSSTIYGYFVNRELNKNSTNDLLLMYSNKNIKPALIQDKVFYISEFYITDIKLEKISYQNKEVEDFVRDNKLLISISNIDFKK